MSIKEWLYLILLAVVVGGGVFGINRLKQLYQAEQQNESRAAVLENTSAGVADGVAADLEQQARDAAKAKGVTEYNRINNEAKRHEPETAARATRDVPASLRNAYRARRIARERSGCVDGERGASGEACPAAER